MIRPALIFCFCLHGLCETGSTIAQNNKQPTTAERELIAEVEALRSAVKKARDLSQQLTLKLHQYKRELDQLKTANAALQAQLEKRDPKGAKLLQNLLRAHEEMKSKLAARQEELSTFRARTTRLESELRDAQRTILQLKQSQPGTRPGPDNRPALENRPPNNVTGKVIAVDGDTIQIDVGAKAGVSRDHVLEVYRLRPSPKYLGKIRVLRVTDSKAIATAVGRRADKIIPGDKVAARLRVGDK